VLDHGLLLANTAFDTIDCRFQLLDVQVPPKLNIYGQENLAGAKLHGKQLSHPVHRRIQGDDVPHSIDSSSVRSLPDEQRAAFPAEKDGERGQQQADENGSSRIEVRIVEDASKKNAQKCQESTY
jgi:hypothetical protein